MAISTQAELFVAVANWLNRSDLTQNIPEFVALAEGTLARRLRRRTQRVRVTFTAGFDHYDLWNQPTHVQFAEVTLIRLVRNGPDLRDTGEPNFWWPAMTRSTMLGVADMGAVVPVSARPRVYTVIDLMSDVGGAFLGKQIVMAPTPDTDYIAEITGQAVYLPVSGTVTLLRESPDLLLYGALVHSAPFLEHDERIQMWQGFFERAIAEVNQQRKAEELSGAPMPVRLPVILTG